MISETPAPTILVSVGTDHHRFDRLVGWVDDWARRQAPGTVACLVQYGASRPPELALGVPFLDNAELHEQMARARAVVCHGGPSTIAEARRHGHLPIVVPRSPELDEHVDDHQQRFAHRLAEKGLVRLAASPADLEHALDEALAAPAPAPAPAPASVSAAADGATRVPAQPAGVEAALRFGELVETLFAEAPATERRR